MKLKGALVVVTGASSGIGAACALELARAGANLALLGRNQAALEHTARQVQAVGGMAQVFVVDIGDAAKVQAVAKELEALGTVGAIVHSAGAGRWLFLEETPVSEALEMLNAPFLGALWLTQALLPAMLEQRAGRLLFVGSPAAWVAWPGATVYASSRWALRGLFEALDADLAGTGVGVSMVVPGQVSSPYFENNPGVKSRFPRLGRLIPTVTPQAVARAVRVALERERRIVALPWMVRALLLLNHAWPWLVRFLVVQSGFKHPASLTKKL